VAVVGVLERDVHAAWTVHGLGEDDPRAWRLLAACDGVPIQVFFPEKGCTYTTAKRICSSCPVIAECRRDTDTIEGRFPGPSCGDSSEARPRERGRGAGAHRLRERPDDATAGW
jgi:hypothetical protein